MFKWVQRFAAFSLLLVLMQVGAQWTEVYPDGIMQHVEPNPIYNTDDWSPSGDVYVGGTTGLLIWAVTLAGILAGGALLGTRDNQSNVSKVFSQLNEVALLKSSNSAPVPDTKPMEPAKQSAAQNTNPDASSISAFMTQVADLGTRNNQSNVSKVFSQLNEVALLKSSNSAPVPDTKPMEPAKQSAAQNTNPDASSISAFMTQVADLVEMFTELVLSSGNGT
ncbi:hypothetical protein TEA_029904 [Camellia sinensis var. sinensis]|uniref:Photosystem II 10 kDa polypeptide, chloroplastic n=1 Tax=Camellia sinensis var. sinensis TaxID=542762 RepID=A0A4S4CWV8_CAMSN|nr:hypothetical protein TEA_029904 [Camellia sinensis var. sinensis]